MYFASNNNVGIGHDNPSAKLHTTGTILIDESAGTSNSAVLRLEANRGSSGQDSGEIRFYNQGGSDHDYARIVGVRGGANESGSLQFRTSEASTEVTGMTISSTGNVDIGGTLTVNGTNATIANASNPYLYLNDTNAGSAIFQQSGNDTRIGSDSNTQVLFVQNNQTAVTINTDKNVGIGTGSPNKQLHVHEPSAGASHVAFTNTDTGLTTEFIVGITSGEIAEVWNENNTPLRFATNDTERMRIDNSGTTIIGTHNSNAHRLAIESKHSSVPYGQLVAGSSDQNQAVGFQFTVRDSNGDERDKMFLTDTGLGIGSTAPSSSLVVSSGTNTGIEFSPDHSNTRVNMFVIDRTASVYENLRIDAETTTFRTTADSVTLHTNMVLDSNSRISLSNNDASGAVGTTLFGYNAGLSVVSGAIQNTFIGHEVSDATMTNGADYNTAVGASSMSALTSGTQNTAHGMNSLHRVTSGSYNTAIGVASLEDITTTSNNTAVGRQSGFYSVGTDNTYIGYQSGLGSDGSGADNYNTAVGSLSLTAITTGAENTAVGYQSLDANTIGHYNTAFGHTALSANVAGDSNTGIGARALISCNPADGTGYNSSLGFNSGYFITNGEGNTIVGAQSGATGSNNLSTGDNNTLIGKAVGTSIADAQNQTVIGQGATGVADNSVTLGNSSVTDVYMAQDSGAYVHSQNVPNHVANTMSSPYYRFDGTDDLINIGDEANLEFSTNMSISVWVKCASSTITGVNGLFGKWLDSGSQKGYFLAFLDDEKLYFYTSSSGSNATAVATGVLTDLDKWNHFTVTYNAGAVTFYRNGVSIATGTGESSIYANSANAYIGAYQAGANFFNGEMSKVQVFNNTLTATEVKELYSGASVPFKYKGASQTNTLGSLDFTSSWSTSNASITDSDTFTVSADNGFIAKNFSAGDVGKQYRLRIAGTVSSGDLQVQNRNGSANILTGLNGTFDQTTEYTYEGDNDKPIILRLTSSGATADITHLSIVRIGAVAEYDGSGIASDKWLDKSGNDLHGDVTGASVENAPSSDDGLVYEEGTWTPSFNESGSATVTGNNYVRIGNLVKCYASLIDIQKSGSPTSDVVVSGLPYPVKVSGVGGTVSTSFIDFENNTGNVSPYVTTSETLMFYFSVDNAEWHGLNWADITTNDDIICSFDYIIE
jgi:hypothetical protein